MNPKVTIVTPVFNRENYLGTAVESVERQTYGVGVDVTSEGVGVKVGIGFPLVFALHQ